MSSWSLEGRNILITGGTQGIGAAVVDEALAHSASTVIFCSRKRDCQSEKSLADKQERYPNTQLHHVLCDLSTEAGPKQLADAIVTLGVTKLHGLVNNVGVNVRKDMTQQTMQEYQTMVRTNQDSAYFLCQALLPFLENIDGGASIVNVSSAAGVQSSGTGVAYSMTKAALNQMTRGLACEWATRRIRVNAVAPWMTWTPLLREAIQSNPDQLLKVQAWTPMHRLAEASEIAAPIIFLLLPASSYITGQILGVDGGLTAQGFDGPCVTQE